ncbi:CCR4-NOT transcription complex subunit 4 [Blastomyces dermatitidis ATCC 18188]|uniref:CCR4-NOT transcription complex subunit 4 n=1 Tax=Ajellomyces dermatitidis (strain ATCC 18188 / CBS 674.68) TaxID=653446 RepID=A0A0J9EK28_AJEDA|nr:CCR4-NOT transcription complex subunit 4 [Blastomyces dermatitidis ATCC 18188]
MSFRTQHDTVIDDDDESCPLCIEEFDLSDKNFKPCPCGYQICQFCYNNIKTHSEEGRCPNCRRVYDESTIQYRVPDADEFKADLALKHRKAAAAKKREAEKREIEASSRRNLAGVRVVQKNLVYVIGLNPTIRDESQLLQTLRGDQYFGQYGDIEKIVVSKAKPGGNPNQGIGVYVTFARKADAATCIAAVDGSPNGDRVLRAQYGTTKYCSSFLRNEQCNNRNCTFLHETGEDNDSFSRQDLSSMNTLSSQRVHPNPPTGPGPSTYSPYTHHAQPVRPPSHPIQIPTGAQPMRRQNSRDEAGNRINTDSSALPSSASWANKDSHVQRARRPSLAASRSSPSPKGSNAVVNKIEDLKRSVERQSHSAQDSSRQQTPTIPEASGSSSRANRPASPSPPGLREISVLDDLVKAVNSPDFRFIFSTAGLSPEELAYIENHPSMIDPYGGVKRRAMREKAEHERANQETDNQMLLHLNTNEEENLEGGSSQLGGEPEEMHSAGASGRNTREPLSAIQPPSQQTTTANSAIGSPVSAGHQFQGLNMAGRSLTPLQQQQLLLLKNAGGQHMGLMDQLQSASISSSFEHNPQQRAAVYQNQMPQMTGVQGHARQSSRFSFVNDANAKNASNQRLVNQQASTMQNVNPNPLNVSTGQHGLGSHYFVSGVQGPPPGLKTAGTPPISGGGMFAQGHGFTSTMNNNLGLGTKQDPNPDLMRELMRGRSGTSGGGGVQAHEAAKLDLADPSILQARMHQSAAGATPGQGLYGSQGQADEDFPPLGPPTKPLDKRPLDTFRIASGSRASHGSNDSPYRSGTPVLPPGLPLPHGHPAAPFIHDLSPSTSALSSPQPGHITLRSGFSTPVQKLKELNPSTQPTPDAQASSAAPSVPARTRTAAEISSGSPKPKSLAASRSQSDSLTAKKDKAREASPGKAAALTTKDGKQSSETHGKPVPIKLNLSMATSGHASPSRATTPNHSLSSIPQLTNAASRPNTPLIGVSRASDSPAPRQARVLRVVDTSKSDTPTTPHNSTPPTKHLSRQPSLSTNSRPDTPNNGDSEYDIHTSASVSRASSPPPSRVGSAPVRTITKSQLKKERKLKAKQAEIKKEETLSTSVVAEEPVQAPIIGRKRKTKKAPTPTSEHPPSSGAKSETIDSTPQSAKSSKNKTQNKPETSTQAKGSDKTTRENASKEQTPQSLPAEKDEKSEPWRSNNTTGQLLADSEASGIPVKDLFLERTSPLPVLLAQLHQSGDLDLNTHPLFNPPNLNQRSDLKCTADDYDILKKPIELAEEHRTRLLQGEPVHINAESDLLKYRCLITPTGCVLRHLSEEEENRYLELEKSLAAAWESLQEYPALTVTEPDATNRGGGLDALFATPEKFNIRWIDGVPENGLLSGPAKPSSLPSPPPLSANGFSTGSTASEIAVTARASASAGSGVTHASVPRSSTAPKLATSESHLGVSLEELMSMSDEELRAMIEDAQRELESSRKEVDMVDKKVMTLVKRNKKLVQQALSAAMEFVGSASDMGL